MGDRGPGCIVLMGLRGSGKSTAGRAAAARLGALFVDLDERSARELGCARVAEAWERHGEAAFRAGEARALRAALDDCGRRGASALTVLALGGGTPAAPGAAEALRAARDSGLARLIYLRASPAALRARLVAAGGAGADRPSLTGADPLAEIEAVFGARDGLYRALADEVIECDGMTLEEVAARLAGRVVDE